MENTDNCSSNPSQSPSFTPPPNAFTPEFLKALEAREDAPLAALEADSRGPWKVVQLPVAAVVAVPRVLSLRLVDAVRGRTGRSPSHSAPGGDRLGAPGRLPTRCILGQSRRKPFQRGAFPVKAS
jgi:hypothetical protein